MERHTNWSQSVTAVVIREGKVLLARHAYVGNPKNGEATLYGID